MTKFFTALSVAFVSFINVTRSEPPTTLTGNDAEKKISGAEIIRIAKSSDVPAYIQFRKGSEKEFDSFTAWFHSALGIDNSMGLKLLSTEKDKLGMVHYRYQETNNGFPLEGTMYIVHTKNNQIVSMNGFIFKKFIGVATSAGINEETALQNALNYTHAESYKWQHPASEAQLKEATNNANATWFPKGILVYAPAKGEFLASNYRLTYKFDIYAEKPLKRNYVFVDAQSGEIIFEQNRIHDIDVSATGVTVYSGSRPIMTESNGGNYRLHETGRGNGVMTYNNLSAAQPAGTTDFTNATTTWNNVNANLDQYATDAHWGAEKTYDFYDSTFNRNSIDGAGFALISYVHVDVNLVNAFWDGTEMSYGDGDGTTYTPLTAIDVTGHEITHGLTQFTSNLGNVPEGGAINEGFSDCMGMSIRQFAYNSGTIDWLIGDQIGGAIFRDDGTPHNTQNPDTYLGQYWDPNQEVHQNSTVFSHCYYLVTMGGSGTNDNANVYSVTGLGLATAEQIWYRMETVYMNPNTDYPEARLDAIQSATDLYGGCSPEVIAVTNAWYAVGVGAAYVTGPTVCNFTTSQTNYCNLPATVLFTNTSTNGGGYTWNFGDGTTSTATNPSHVYNSAGSYTVKLVANSTCGIDSLINTNYISINPLSAPTVISPVSIGCGNTASLSASGTSLNWFATSAGGIVIDTGTTHITGVLNNTTTYYVQSVVSSPGVYANPVDNTLGAGGNNTTNHYEVFNVNQPCTLVSVLVYATGAGNRTITLNNSSGTVLQTATVYIPDGQSRVTLNFTLTVGTNYQLQCQGTPNLYRNSAGAAYPYTDPNGFVSITGNDVPDPARYYFFYDWELAAIPCTSALIPVTVNVSGGVTPSFTDTQLGSNVTFTNTSSGGTTWLWNFGDGTTGTTQNPVHLYAANGTYNVVLHVYNGVCSDSITQTVTINTTGINEMSTSEGMTLYPNPTAGSFTLALNLSATEKAEVKIINVLGELMYQSSINNHLTKIDLSDFSKGLYFVQVKTASRIFTKRIVLE